MSYFNRKKRVPSFRELNEGGRTSTASPSRVQSDRQCYGRDYDYRVIECRDKCPDRFKCMRICQENEGSPSSVPAKQKTAHVQSSRVEKDDDDFDYDEVDPPDGVTLSGCYARNAALGAAEKATDELLFLIRSAPRYSYRFKNRRKT